MKQKKEQKRYFPHLSDENIVKYIQKTAIQISELDPIKRRNANVLIKNMNQGIKNAMIELDIRKNTKTQPVDTSYEKELMPDNSHYEGDWKPYQKHPRY